MSKILKHFFVVFLLLLSFVFVDRAMNFVFAEEISQTVALSDDCVDAKSAILMEKSTGTVIYKLNENKKVQIASVTKIMTMLIASEAIESGKIKEEDIVEVSEYAASMGGSQVFLEPHEKMTVGDLLKSVVIVSGNDAAVALAEHISGSEASFVELMNKRAAELGAVNSHFVNCNGLCETDEHYSTALDVAIISREVLKHECLRKYMTTWMDTIRNGEFQLSNTNKLLKSYSGATGIKTGSEKISGFCLAASAKRENTEFIAIVLGAETSKLRFSEAANLLNYAFANYTIVDSASFDISIPPVKVFKSKIGCVTPILENKRSFLLKKGDKSKVSYEICLGHQVIAPLKAQGKIGEVIFKLEDNEIFRENIIVPEDIPKIGFVEMLYKITNSWTNIAYYFFSPNKYHVKL